MNEMGEECSMYVERRGIYRDLLGKPDGKRPLTRRRCRWENNIKISNQYVKYQHATGRETNPVLCMPVTGSIPWITFNESWIVWVLRLSQRCCWNLKRSGILGLIGLWIVRDVSEFRNILKCYVCVCVCIYIYIVHRVRITFFKVGHPCVFSN